MTRSRQIFLGLALGLLLGLAFVEQLTATDPEQRNWEVFTEMAYSKAFEAHTANPAFADGKTIQPLVAGVVPRGVRPFRYGDGEDEAQRAGRELTDPLPEPDGASTAQGAELYRVYCLPCHDARGGGRGPVVLRGMLPPPSLHAQRAVGMADGQLFHVLTRGQGNMAAYTAQLSVDERWLVVRHVRRLQEEGP